MNYRSTNTKGYVHFGGDIVSGVEDGRGIQLGTASTSATPAITPAGDDTAVNLAVLPKGSGAVYIGSTAAGAGGFKGAFSTTFAYAFTALSSGASVESAIASTTADVSPGDLISLELGLPAVSTQVVALLNFRTSTAATSRVVLTLGNITSTALGSTGSGTGRITWIDLT